MEPVCTCTKGCEIAGSTEYCPCAACHGHIHQFVPLAFRPIDGEPKKLLIVCICGAVREVEVRRE